MIPLKECRMSFLQQILVGRKKCLLQADVPHRQIPRWPQLATKTMYPQIVTAYPEIKDYLPDKGDYTGRDVPPREFFFSIFAALKPQEFERMIREAAAYSKPTENLQEQKWRMAISDEWMEKLLMHDFISSKKGRGSSSLLINGIGKARTSKKRKHQDLERSDMRSEGTISQKYSGAFPPMDVSRFSKKRKVDNNNFISSG